MAKQRILIVEDEDDICMILSYSLQKAGYETLIANSAEEALEKYQTAILNGEVDLILLDIMMGEMSGLELAKRLQLDNIQFDNLPPIIFLTALSDESTVLQGFSLGADDYISKPFRMSEVLARIAAVLRRTAEQGTKSQEPRPISNDYIVFDGIEVNTADMSLRVDGESVVMTRKEMELLVYLLNHRGQIISREDLLDNVWDSNGFVMARTVDVHITHLRRKLGAYGKHIVTKTGFGYIFKIDL